MYTIVWFWSYHHFSKQFTVYGVLPIPFFAATHFVAPLLRGTSSALHGCQDHLRGGAIRWTTRVDPLSVPRRPWRRAILSPFNQVPWCAFSRRLMGPIDGWWGVEVWAAWFLENFSVQKLWLQVATLKKKVNKMHKHQITGYWFFRPKTMAFLKPQIDSLSFSLARYKGWRSSVATWWVLAHTGH